MRGQAFAFLFIILFLIEYAMPRIKKFYDFKRIIRNLALPIVFHLISIVLIPFTLLEIAQWASTNQIGLFNYIKLPSLFDFIIGLVLLDLIIYWQHRIFHKVPFLWKLHRVHHTDKTLDVSSALRFHPAELFISVLIKFFFVVVLGINATTAVTFEIVLNGMAMFNHGNIRIPSTIDFILRKFIVTPDFHRTHHSDEPSLMHSNFGFNLSFWDYLFGSYRTVSYEDHPTMHLGVKGFDQEKSFSELLKHPFKGDVF